MANDTSVGVNDADAARNRVFGAGIIDDPYPRYHELTAECPVRAGLVADHFGVPGLGVSLFPDRPQIAAYSYAAVQDVLRDNETFSSTWYEPSMAHTVGTNMIGMDEPEHKRQRLLLQRAFSKREMRWWSTDIIQPIVDGYLDAVVPLGRADLYVELAAKVPIHTISVALGLPERDRQRFFDWAVAMTSTVETIEARLAACRAVADYVRPLVADRRRAPQRDLITVLVQAQVPAEDDDGTVATHPLTDEEIEIFIRLLIIAGAGTTFRAFGLLLYHLLENPEQLAAVADDRSLVEAAIEETLRIEQPLVHFGRLATRDTTLHGCPVPAGAVVTVNVGSANHDPVEWPDPDRFDIHRAHPDRHLTFGFGKHHCLGVHLARAELATMLNSVLDRMPNIEWDPDQPRPTLTGFGFRMVTGLPVRWGNRR